MNVPRHYRGDEDENELFQGESIHGSRINPRATLWHKSSGWANPCPGWLACRPSSDLGTSPKFCYGVLVRYYDERKGYAYPSLGKLAKAQGITIRAVSKQLRQLIDQNLIRGVQQGNRQVSHYYFLHHKWEDEYIPEGDDDDAY